MAFTGKNPRFTSVLLTDALATTPSSPPSGAHKLIDRNGSLFLRDSNGTETPVGGGAGEKNYILAPSTAVGWTASGAGITVATSTTAAELPRENTTRTGIKITGVSGSTAYAYYRFTLDDADWNRKCKIKFDIKPVSGYVASDMKVDLYSNTASNYGGTSTRIVTSADASAICAIPNATGSFQIAVDMPDSTAPYMELRIGLNATSTQAIVISDVVVGPGTQPQGAVVQSSVSFTPSVSGVAGHTSTGSTGKWWRIGEEMVLCYDIVFPTIFTSGSPITIAMPTGYTADTSKIATQAGSTTYVPNAAMARLHDVGTATYPADAFMVSNAFVLYAILDDAGAGSAYVGGGTATSTTVPFTWANNDRVTLYVRVPIAEWAGSGTVNVAQNDVEYASNSSTTDADDTTSFVYGPAGSTVPSTLTGAHRKRVRFQTPYSDGDSIVLEVKGTGPWATFIGDEENGVSVYGVQNASTYGIGLRYVAGTPTDFDIYFGQYAQANGATFGAAGRNWSGPNGAGMKWRLKKVKGGKAVGFGKATDGSLGLINTYVSTTDTTFTFQGGTPSSASASKTLRIQRLGDWVTLYVPPVSVTTGTSNTNFTSDTALPTWARPLTGSQTFVVMELINNGAVIAGVGYGVVTTAGIISVYRDATATAYSNAATAGLNRGQTFSYYVGTGS